MTTTTAPEADYRLLRAEVALIRSGIELADDVDHDQVVAMLARLLDRHDPADDPHGRLLLAALRGRSRAEKRTSRRPLAERAVRALLRTGSSPTPTAVAARLRQYEEADQALAAKRARLTPRVEEVGPAAAQVVIDHWRRAGRAPGPLLIGDRLGWNSRDTMVLVHLLVEAGWLANENRHLTPGPRARGPVPLVSA